LYPEAARAQNPGELLAESGDRVGERAREFALCRRVVPWGTRRFAYQFLDLLAQSTRRRDRRGRGMRGPLAPAEAPISRTRAERFDESACQLVATRANGQPAFGIYVQDPHASVLHATGLIVITLTGSKISAITRFDTGVLARFGLPRTLPTG